MVPEDSPTKANIHQSNMEYTNPSLPKKQSQQVASMVQIGTKQNYSSISPQKREF